MVERNVLLELKSVEHLIPLHRKKIQAYLSLTDLALSLLFYFGVALMKDGMLRCVHGFEERLMRSRELRYLAQRRKCAEKMRTSEDKSDRTAREISAAETWGGHCVACVDQFSVCLLRLCVFTRASSSSFSRAFGIAPRAFSLLGAFARVSCCCVATKLVPKILKTHVT